MFSLSRNRKQKEGALPTAKILPFRNRKSVVALDLEGDTLRVVQAAGHGASTRITRIASAKIELAAEKRDNAAALGGAVKAALSSLKIHPKDVALSLSRAQVVLRPLQVPMVADVRELASIINFQIAKDLPFRIEDAVVDFKVLRAVDGAPAEAPAGGAAAEAAPRKQLEVLVGAVRSDVVEFNRQLARAAGFKLTALGLRSVASACCAAKCVPATPDKSLLLISVRRDETAIDVLVDGKLVFSRAASVSAPLASDLTAPDRAAFLQALEIEVVRSLHSYEGATNHRPIGQVLVAGGTALESGVAQLLAERLGFNAHVLDPATALHLADSGADQARAAIAPLGLALSALESGGLPLDFANPKKPAGRSHTQRTQVLVGAVAAVALLVTLLAVRQNFIKKRMNLRQEAQATLTDAEKKLPIYRRLKLQTKTVNGWVADDQNWLNHIAYLSTILPGADELYISSFTTSPQHLIRFSVQAKSGELLAELDKKLRAAGYEVRPLSITPANDRNGYNFRTTVELAIPKKLKPDIAKTKPPPRPQDDISLTSARKP